MHKCTLHVNRTLIAPWNSFPFPFYLNQLVSQCRMSVTQSATISNGFHGQSSSRKKKKELEKHSWFENLIWDAFVHTDNETIRSANAKINTSIIECVHSLSHHPHKVNYRALFICAHFFLPSFHYTVTLVSFAIVFLAHSE